MLYKLLYKQLNFGVLPKVVTEIIMLLVVTDHSECEISMRFLLKNILLSSFFDYTSHIGPTR